MTLFQKIRSAGASRLLMALFAVTLLDACSKPEDGASNAPAPWIASGKGRIDIEGGVIRLAARRDGIVARVLVEEGERVSAGQVLAELDFETARRHVEFAKAESLQSAAERQKAKVELQAAERESRRLQSLIGNEDIAQQEIDLAADRLASATSALRAADAALTAAQARVALGEREIDERRIVAPLSGLIAQRTARPGNGVSTLNVTPLFVFVPDVPRIARIEVEEHALPGIFVGQSVDVVLDADNSRHWSGSVLRIGHLVAQRSPGDDPGERQDNRVVEVVVSIEAREALIGQRVIARFARNDHLTSAEGGKP